MYNLQRHPFRKWDSFGMLHSRGSCVLLEVQIEDHSTEYFEILHQTSPGIFELRGVVHILLNNKLQPVEVPQCKLNIPQPATLMMTAGTIWPQMRLKNLFVFWNAVALYHYSICVSTVKSGSFWKRVTLNAICDHGGKYFQTWQADCESLSSNVIPNNLQIYYADINITFKLWKDGVLSTMCTDGKLMLQNLISDSASVNTGFLL